MALRESFLRGPLLFSLCAQSIGDIIRTHSQFLPLCWQPTPLLPFEAPVGWRRYDLTSQPGMLTSDSVMTLWHVWPWATLLFRPERDLLRKTEWGQTHIWAASWLPCHTVVSQWRERRIKRTHFRTVYCRVELWHVHLLRVVPGHSAGWMSRLL